MKYSQLFAAACLSSIASVNAIPAAVSALPTRGAHHFDRLEKGGDSEVTIYRRANDKDAESGGSASSPDDKTKQKRKREIRPHTRGTLGNLGKGESAYGKFQDSATVNPGDIATRRRDAVEEYPKMFVDLLKPGATRSTLVENLRREDKS